jgi:outer membrane receptor protein involved in Fe transport
MQYSIIIICSLLTSVALIAQEKSDFESLFKEVSDFTTRTNINIDHQPSVLTVLYSDDLKAMGVRTINEAFDFVPGIETSGNNQIVTRGASEPNNFVYLKMKYFIDGVDLGYHYYGDFPIELIDRIEVLRGGASAIYGQGAFLGAVNIITKSSHKSANNTVNVEAGSFDYRKGSALLHTQVSGWDIGFDTYYKKHNRTVDAPNAPVALLADPLPLMYGVNGTFSGEKISHEGLREGGFGLIAHNDEWRFTSRYFQKHSQNYYGFFGVLDFDDSGYTDYRTASAQLTYESKLSDDFSLKADVGISQNQYEVNTYYYQIEPNMVGLKNPHFNMQHTIQTTYTEVALESERFDNHRIKIGAYAGYIDVTKNQYAANVDRIGQIGAPDPFVPGVYWANQTELTTLSGEKGVFALPSEQQKLLSYYLQELYHASDALDLSLNIRLDDYEFFNSMLSWRAALVYSEDDINIYKLIASRAYRAPSYSEAFTVDHFGIYIGNPTLKAESVDTYEAAYVYTRSPQTLRANLYYSIYKNAIDASLDDLYIYQNISQNRYSHGVELEYTQEFENRSKLMLNGRYTEYKYTNVNLGTDVKIDNPNISQVMAHAAYLYPLTSSLSWSNVARYYGKKELAKYNGEIDDVVLWDSTLNYRYSKDITASLIVKNAFDTIYYCPSAGTNVAPIQREGRVIYASLEYDF